MTAKKPKWIKWEGGKMPCAASDFVEIRTRAGWTEESAGSGFFWPHDGGDYDIVAYRVIKAADKPAKRPRAKPAAPARKRRPAVPKHKDRADLVGALQEASTRKIDLPAINLTPAPKPSRFDLLAVMFDNIDKPSMFLLGCIVGGVAVTGLDLILAALK